MFGEWEGGNGMIDDWCGMVVGVDDGGEVCGVYCG